MKNFALLIKKYRESRGLSQKELAEKAGIGNGTIGDIERGDRKGKLSTLDKISKALNLTFEERRTLDNAFIGRDSIKPFKDDVFENTLILMSIPVYSSVAAGLGYIPDSHPVDYITIPKTSGECVGIRVVGDSMEPTFCDGDIVIIKKDIEVSIGDIGVFINSNTGESFVKRLKRKENILVLESDNNNYVDIKITDEIVSCGKVISIIKKDLRKKQNNLLEKIEKLSFEEQQLIEKMINGLLNK